MSNNDDGGSAFPHPQMPINALEYFLPSCGMSLRDWFAGQALVGELAAVEGKVPWPADKMELLAFKCYNIADAMLKHRKM